MASTKPYVRPAQDVKIPEAQANLKAAIEQELSSLVQFAEPLRWEEYGLTITVPREKMFEVFSTLKTGGRFKFNMLSDVTAVDWMDRREPRFEVVYQLLSLTYLHRICVKVVVGEDNPEVDSVRPLWEGANFLEREVWDMFGIKFKGHGDLRRILMYDEFVGYPLRKDYPLRAKQPRVPLRVPELRNTSADMFRDELVALPSRSKQVTNG